MKISLGIVDDHRLFLKSLVALLQSFVDFEIIVEASHGEDLLQKLSRLPALPNILLVDVDMPIMSGPQTVEKVSKQYPEVKCVALSMKEDDTSILSMIRAGCCAYLLKDIGPDDLQKSLIQIHDKGYYNADAANINYRRLIMKASADEKLQLSEREKVFLQLACSDRTYKQIAAEMFLSERTIDGYREVLFEKFNVQSRVGMAMEAIRRGLVKLDHL